MSILKTTTLAVAAAAFLAGGSLAFAGDEWQPIPYGQPDKLKITITVKSKAKAEKDGYALYEGDQVYETYGNPVVINQDEAKAKGKAKLHIRASGDTWFRTGGGYDAYASTDQENDSDTGQTPNPGSFQSSSNDDTGNGDDNGSGSESSSTTASASGGFSASGGTGSGASRPR